MAAEAVFGAACSWAVCSAVAGITITADRLPAASADLRPEAVSEEAALEALAQADVPAEGARAVEALAAEAASAGAAVPAEAEPAGVDGCRNTALIFVWIWEKYAVSFI